MILENGRRALNIKQFFKEQRTEITKNRLRKNNKYLKLYKKTTTWDTQIHSPRTGHCF